MTGKDCERGGMVGDGSVFLLAGDYVIRHGRGEEVGHIIWGKALLVWEILAFSMGGRE